MKQDEGFLEVKEVITKCIPIMIKSMLLCIPFLTFTFWWVAVIPLEPSSLLSILIIGILPTITSVGPSAIYILYAVPKLYLSN